MGGSWGLGAMFDPRIRSVTTFLPVWAGTALSGALCNSLGSLAIPSGALCNSLESPDWG